MKQNTITIRPATADDFEAILGLLRDGNRYHQSLRVFGKRSDTVDITRETFDAHLASDNQGVFLAVKKGQYLGFVRVEELSVPEGRFHAARTFADVHEIVVAEGCRGIGIGRKLIQVARDWTAKRGITSLELNCFGSNTSARDFYTHLGFVEHRIRFRLDLSAPKGSQK